jgi:hypothetical protein
MVLAASPLDEFDRWASERDRRYDGSMSARYVSPDVVGYQDLDDNGSWRVDATYGNVWTPNRVAAGWAPYRDGHWSWIDPWGWTWVDDAPWGFAVSHYGRWANFSGTWGWVPGPVRSPAYYAPALVVFVGGNQWQLTIASGSVLGVAWFPLAPREVYRPAYPVSRGYFENINRSNTVINTTVVNNTYNNINVSNIVYANRRVPGAVVAVPTTTFVQSQPVATAARPVPHELVSDAPVVIAAPLVPTERSVHGAAARRDKPPARIFERPVVAVSAPPTAHAGFAAQQAELSATPGRPLDRDARRDLQRATDAPTPVVKVIAAVPRTSQPQRASPAETPTPQRGGTGKPDKAETRGRPVAAPAAKPERPARQAAPASAPASSPESRNPGEQKKDRGEQGRDEDKGKQKP